MTRLPPGDVRPTGPRPISVDLVVLAALVIVAGTLAAVIASRTDAASPRATAASLRPAECGGRCEPMVVTNFLGLGGDVRAIDATPSLPATDTDTGAVPSPAPDEARSRPTASPRPRARRTHDLISGVATWHATGRDGSYAAAGPLLRAALGGGWRGMRVFVCSGGRCIRVTLNDVCWCPRGRRLVDLSDEAFARLAPLSRGVIEIEVRR